MPGQKTVSARSAAGVPLGLWGSLQKTFPHGQRCETHHREHTLCEKGPSFTASPMSDITARPLERSNALHPYVTLQKEQLSGRNTVGITVSQRLRVKNTSATPGPGNQPTVSPPPPPRSTDPPLPPSCAEACLQVKGPHCYSLWPVWYMKQQTVTKHGFFTLSPCLSVERP